MIYRGDNPSSIERDVIKKRVLIKVLDVGSRGETTVPSIQELRQKQVDINGLRNYSRRTGGGFGISEPMLAPRAKFPVSPIGQPTILLKCFARQPHQLH